MIQYETDSRNILPGQTFVAIKGSTVDGHDYINAAIKNGATSVIGEREVLCSVPLTVVPNSSLYLKEKLVAEYSKQLSSLSIIGVTGTNGKTTTCYLTYQLLKALGVKVAYMGTIGFYFEDEKRELPNTTPEVLTIYKLLLSVLERGCTTVVMEVSSHSLALERIAGLHFKIGGFTNLTEDHLDYHKTMANYLQAKLHLLDYMDEDGVFLVNKDDPYSTDFENKFKNTKTLGIGDYDYAVTKYSMTPAHTKINFKYKDEEYFVQTNLTSKFNIYNYMMSCAIVHEFCFSFEDIIAKTSEIYPPRGRCETYPVKDGFAVVDYAHTPDAVEKVIETYRSLTRSKIITIIGCGGDRDPLKRPIMGNIATEKSDYVIFTNDNPRTEKPQTIMEQIIKGVKKDNYEIILDRHEAIFKALDQINKDDIVLILGKGHEDYQIIGHEKIHFDDKEQINDYLKKCEN